MLFNAEIALRPWLSQRKREPSVQTKACAWLHCSFIRNSRNLATAQMSFRRVNGWTRCGPATPPGSHSALKSREHRVSLSESQGVCGVKRALRKGCDILGTSITELEESVWLSGAEQEGVRAEAGGLLEGLQRLSVSATSALEHAVKRYPPGRLGTVPGIFLDYLQLHEGLLSK